MPINPVSKANLESGKRFSADNQPANRGRNALEFAIREALLSGDKQEIKTVVLGLIEDAKGFISPKTGRVIRNYDAVKILFEHGFSKPKTDVDVSSEGGIIIQVVTGVPQKPNA